MRKEEYNIPLLDIKNSIFGACAVCISSLEAVLLLAFLPLSVPPILIVL